MNRAWQGITPVLLFVAAFAVRALPWNAVFQGDRIVPIDGDAYYHLRRIRYTLEHFPDVLRFDPWMNFPEGAQPIWSPAFDWLVALFLLPLPGIDDPDTFETFAVLVPPLLGACSVVVVYFVAKRFFSRATGIIAAILLAVLPGHTIYSKLGAVDHHVAVSLCATIMLALMMALLRRDIPADMTPESESEAAENSRFWWLSASVGLAMAGAVILWPGALIHVGVIQLAMIGRLISSQARSRAMRWAQSFALANGVAAIAVLPFSAGNEWTIWGSMNPVVLSNFQSLYLLVAASCFGLSSLLWKVDRIGARVSTRLASAAAVGSVALVGLMGTNPELTAGATDAFSWLSKEDDFQALVGESQPLFSGVNGIKRARSFLGDFVFLVPLALPLLAWRLRARADHLLLVGWGFAFYLITLLQWRFVNTYAIAQSLLVAIAIVGLYEGLDRRLSSRSAFRAALGTTAILVFIASLPALRFHADDFGSFVHRIGGRTAPLTSSAVRTRFFEVAAEFLRDHTPLPTVSSYSVLAPWSFGHLVKYVAERPVVQDNFGNDVAPENFVRADAYFLATEEGLALETIAPTRARYVVVHPIGAGHSRDYAPDSMFSRLRDLQGARGRPARTAGERPSFVEALRHHRLVYQSGPLRKGATTPFITIFEIVPGALIVGTAEPGATVRARVGVLPSAGKRFDYDSIVQADENGEYRLRVPYSNERTSPNVGTNSHYALRVGREVKSVTIPESAVLRGEQVRGPSFGG